MKILYVDNAVDYSDWLALWENSIEKDVFTHPDYINLYADNKVRGRSAIYESNAGIIMHPFLFRQIQGESFWIPEVGEAFDIITPYGYGGPFFIPKDTNKKISNDEKEKLFKRFFLLFNRWAIENSVISEFIRFSLFNESRQYYYGTIEHNNDNIVCNLNLTQEELWRGFKHKVRKNVRTAQKHKLEIIEDTTGEYLADFINIYYATMERRKASPFYYFPKSYFEKIIYKLQPYCVFFHVVYKNLIIASEIVLYSAKKGYSFLGGTLENYYYMRPGDLLKFHILQWAKKKKMKQFVIGGGYKPHDGIFAFKEAFAPGGVMPFYVGKNIFDKKKYQLLTSNQKKTQSEFFPQYREYKKPKPLKSGNVLNKIP